MPEPVYTWKIHLFLIGPLIFAVLGILIGVNGLGCSEYPQFNSKACIEVTEFLGFDIYRYTELPTILFFMLSFFTTPVAIFFYGKLLIKFMRSKIKKM